jgi:hypothetical protein
MCKQNKLKVKQRAAHMQSKFYEVLIITNCDAVSYKRKPVSHLAPRCSSSPPGLTNTITRSGSLKNAIWGDKSEERALMAKLLSARHTCPSSYCHSLEIFMNLEDSSVFTRCSNDESEANRAKSFLFA